MIRPDGKTCPHCSAKFDQPMKFCGECGKAMA
jgi:predicted amidophosphoribosyltransferase